MVFNKYKTFKAYGRSTDDGKTKSPLLNSIIKKWIKVNQNDYLLFSDNDKALIVSQLTKINTVLDIILESVTFLMISFKR
jgi:hypothetical protein